MTTPQNEIIDPTDAYTPGSLVNTPALDPEAMLLSTLMWSNHNKIEKTITELITPEDFYTPRYGELYALIVTMINNGEGHQAVNVMSELERYGKNHLSDTLLILTGLDSLPILLPSYAANLLAATYRRNFHAAGETLQFAAKEADEDQLWNILYTTGVNMRNMKNRLETLRSLAVISRT